MPRKASSAMGIGVGATEELSLRLSVASLARVLFKHPEAEHEMLALERTATLRGTEAGSQVTVKAQPFGGAVRLRGVSALQALIGDFHFDSERSRSEGDFRIQIRPSDWEIVKRFCLQYLQGEDMSVLEAGPERELAEEFADALRVKITASQYGLTPMGYVIENAPAITQPAQAAPRVRPAMPVAVTTPIRVAGP
jgi:hypothetical protein